MVFHVSCPVTCEKVCFCDLGFRNGLKSEKERKDFSLEVKALEEFLKNTWTVRIGEETGTVQVSVPRIVQRQADEDEMAAMLQRQALEEKAAKEDYFRRLETGAVDLLEEAHSSHGKEQLGSSSVKVMCRICFSGENEGSTKALKMLSCKTCDKKYHWNCIKSWADNRDLFHWSSWECPSCRICEVCRSAGDPSKLMFCRRCDGAYHCYCQTPPHKNVGHGPYVCAKHTRCHSCGSTVPGNGPSTRWFLGYTCCDACGRLFVKGNYCPVCLKVYRDSEMTPMVCCDICENWIHCSCDGISDEKYQQFQSDQNLQYTCAACRGDCYQVKDTDDAVRELWRRKDEYDRKLIASLRANAGLPSHEDASSYLDNEQNYSTNSKHDYGRPLKFSVKGSSDRYMSNSKELDNPTSKTMLPTKTPMKKNIKFVVNAEGSHEKHNNAREIQHLDNDLYSKSEAQNGDQTIQNIMHYNEGAAKNASKSQNVKGSKLVIHIGSKTKNVPGTPKSETSICKEQNMAVSHGYDDISQLKSADNDNQMHETFSRNGKDTKLNFTSTRKSSKHEYEEGPGQPFMIPRKQRKNIGEYTNTCIKKEKDEDIILTKRKQPPSSSTVNFRNDIGPQSSRLKFFSSAVSSDAPKDPKPLLKLKFKSPYFEEKSSWVSKGDEASIVKGQRSKRKRPTIVIKDSFSRNQEEDKTATIDRSQNLLTDQEMEANWILQKLGKDAIGKKVEVHQPSDSSWRRGTVCNVTIQEGDDATCSSLFVIYDDGKTTDLDLKTQAVRFASQNRHKKAKTRH